MSNETGESRWSKGRDGLRKTGPRQLGLVFADSPSGGGTTEPPDTSGRRSLLPHKARNKKTTGSGAGVTEATRLPQVSAQLVLGSDRSIQGAVCVTRTYGSVRGTEE